jgi:hypothetical protein
VPVPHHTHHGVETHAADGRRQRGASTGALALWRSRGLCTNSTSQKEDGTPAGWQCVWRNTHLPRQCAISSVSTARRP